MAEEAEGIRNKKLLVVAILFAAAVVVVYNVHVSRIRRQTKGGQVKLLRINRQMSAGQKITAKDIDVVPVNEDFAKNLGSAVYEKDRDWVLQNSVLNQSVKKDHWLLWSYVTGENEQKPSTAISDGMVAVALELAPQMSLGDILRVGDRVNVLGYLPAGATSYGTYRIIEAVKVLAIGGLGRSDRVASPRRTRRPEGMRSFRQVTIEVSPAESLKLYNVLSHVRGRRVWLELRNPTERPPANAEKVNPQLRKLAEAAAETPM